MTIRKKRYFVPADELPKFLELLQEHGGEVTQERTDNPRSPRGKRRSKRKPRKRSR